jgi:hypothetical protein
LYGGGIAAEVNGKNKKNDNAKGKNNSSGKVSRHYDDLLGVWDSKIRSKAD